MAKQSSFSRAVGFIRAVGAGTTLFIFTSAMDGLSRQIDFPILARCSFFWLGDSEEVAVDLINGIPRFLQICRIDSDNLIHIATAGERWPVDSRVSSWRFHLQNRNEG